MLGVEEWLVSAVMSMCTGTTLHYIRLTASFPDNLGKLAPER